MGFRDYLMGLNESMDDIYARAEKLIANYEDMLKILKDPKIIDSNDIFGVDGKKRKEARIKDIEKIIKDTKMSIARWKKW
jgi:hypothetical protein